MNRIELIDTLLKKQSYIVDILPKRIPVESLGQYMSIDRYFHEEKRLKKISRKFINILLKLNCYYDFDVESKKGWIQNPKPEKLVKWVRQCYTGEMDYLNILLNTDQSLVIIYNDNLHLSFYNLDEKMRSLISQLAASEGLFFREAAQDQ